MWERTLQDLIRGLRAHKTSSQAELDAFLAEAVDEIRQELRGRDMDLKAEGVVKMCYLMMLYPLPPPPSFAFHVVEVMSSPRYHLKQLGYLAAPMAFSTDTEEVVLTVNGIRKDLLAPHAHLPPVALAGLADIVTPSLARDVYADVSVLLTHSRAHVRKRAVLAMFKIFEQYPEALRTGFTRLRDRLEDDDPGVVSATVNVITELSRKSNPRNYLPLAPQLFELLTTSSNNWMLIKIIKLFGALTPLEPRLVRKLLPPITNLISTTPAISLLYECVRTCIVGGMLDSQSEAGDALARVCVEKLSGFLSDEDQNLKYIALLAMVKIVPSHPHLISEYQDEILESLDDQDMSIRMRALELTSNMVNRRNIREIVSRLLKDLALTTSTAETLPSAADFLAKTAASETIAPGPTVASALPKQHLTPAYRVELVRRILSMTSADTYVNITDFEWYMTVLVDLAYVSNVDVGEEIKDRILDVTARVRGNFRPFVVSLMLRLLKDETFVESANQEGNCSEILYAASWVVGEYCHLSKESKKAMIEALLNPILYQINNEISVVTLTAAVKVFAYFTAEAAEDWDLELYNDAKSLVANLMQTLSKCTSSPEVELQERAVNFLQLFRLLEADLSSSKPPTGHARTQDSYKAEPAFENAFAEESSSLEKQNDDIDQPNYPKSLFLLRPLFTGYEINSIGYKAQESVKLPDDLDLDATLVDWKPDDNLDLDFPGDMDDEAESEMGQGGGANLEELRRVLKESGGKGKPSKGKRLNDDGTVETKEQRAARKAARKAKQKDNPYYLNDEQDDVDAIPIVKLELDDNDAVVPTDGKVKRKKAKKPRDPSPPPPEIDRKGEMPEGIEPMPKAKHTPAAKKSKKGHDGLKGIEFGVDDRSADTSDAQRPQTHFEEYREDEVDDPSVKADVVALATSEVQVVRVKKKKKKTTADSSKKKTEV